MPEILFRAVDPEELQAAIVAAVVKELRPLLEANSMPSPRIAGRKEMAAFLGWSLSKLDRRTASGAIPAILDEGRRTYEVDAVLAALRAATPAAEAEAAKRQAAKQAAKHERPVSAQESSPANSMERTRNVLPYARREPKRNGL